MIKNTPKDWLNFLQNCADAADELSRHYFNKAHLKIDQKQNETPVTEADLAIESEIRNIAKATYPTLPIYAEEFGQCPEDAPLKFIIDPIDATQNFVRGIPFVGTLLAIEENGQIVAGVVSSAMSQDRWWAAKGHGSYHSNAFYQEKQLNVSTIDQIENAQAFHGSLYGNEARGSDTDGLLRLLEMSKRQRGFGDFLPHMYVAQGLGEFSIDFNLKPWDIAPLKIIVEEAGGLVTDVTGDNSIYTGTLLSSNGVLHERVLAVYGNAD